MKNKERKKEDNYSSFEMAKLNLKMISTIFF
jgi:hypothetical protein